MEPFLPMVRQVLEKHTQLEVTKKSTAIKLTHLFINSPWHLQNKEIFAFLQKVNFCIQ